jgi:16S rRNA (guanine527-N7)-methyltransferase
MRLYRLPITDYRFPVDLVSLLHPYINNLSESQLAQVSTYLDILLRWNQKTNLTAIREPEKIVTRHFGESLFLAQKLFRCSPDHRITRSPDVLDLGSGAGFPAIPLLIFRPDVTITLVEAHHTKAVFLREVLRALKLQADVKNVRAESLPPASADVVTLRAVEKFDSILPTAAALVRKKKEDEQELVSATTIHSGLALLISLNQISRAQELLPNWRFQPSIPIPKSQNRVIQLVEPSS